MTEYVIYDELRNVMVDPEKNMLGNVMIGNFGFENYVNYAAEKKSSISPFVITRFFFVLILKSFFW